ncbi:MAG TPA: hypothetical protein VGF79_06795 [Bacteroidia bacterium]
MDWLGSDGELKNCRFNPQKLFVGFALSLKSNEDYENAIVYSNSWEYAIYIARNENDDNFYRYADFGKRGGKGWHNSNGRLVIKIKTKVEE